MHKPKPGAIPRWRQVKHRDGSEGCFRSETSRQKDRDRVKRWRANKANKPRLKKARARAFAKWYAKNRAVMRNLDPRLVRKLYQMGLSVVSESQARHPQITMVHPNGRKTTDDECTAEELIRKHNATQALKNLEDERRDTTT